MAFGTSVHAVMEQSGAQLRTSTLWIVERKFPIKLIRIPILCKFAQRRQVYRTDVTDLM